MPGVSSNTCARIFQRTVLESRLAQAELPSIADELFAICGNEVGEWLALPHVVMQPQSAVHRVDHSLATSLKLSNVELVAEFRHYVPAHAGRVLLAGKLSLDDCRGDRRCAAHEHRARNRERQWVRNRSCPTT